MVKDAVTSLWVVPFNLGGRVADLTDWAGNGTQSSATSLSTVLASAPPSVLYSIAGATAIGAMGLLWFMSKPENKVQPLVDLESQTRELKDGSRVCKYLKTDQLHDVLEPDVTTLYHTVRRGARLSKNGPMLGVRRKLADGSEPYHWLHYEQVLQQAENCALGLRQLGIPIGQSAFIGVYSKNRPEWIIIEQAAFNFNNVLVPLYDTLGADACTFIIKQGEISLVVVDAVAKAQLLIQQRDAESPLKFLVVCEESIPADVIKSASDKGIRLLTFAELEKLGASAVDRPAHQPPKPDDLATICYTSGTTGTPKGVMLTHGNIIADGTTLEYFKGLNVGPHDVMMSFLPLAHMFERVVQSVVYTEGGRVGFYRGDIRQLPDDIKTLQPTVCPVVPRVLNRIYDKVMNEVSSSKLKKALLEAAIAFKHREIRNGIIRSNSIFDQLVFKKIRDGMGGRVRLMVTGSAPLAENILTFIRCALGCAVVEGYGQTECVACATITLQGDPVPGHVGVPSPCCAVKLVDVPELNYWARDGAGEICVRGPNVFKGYYKNPEQTAEALDSEGWLHTGDIGRWTNRGTLKIVDRKKHIFKLAQGEYVAPEKIENVYVRSKFVAQSFVYGESLKTCLIGVVVPDPEVLPGECERRLSLSGLSMDELCSRDDVKKMIIEDMQKTGKESGLHSFEQVKDIHLCSEPFTVENDLLTPTLKSKRPNLKIHFKTQLENMYKNLD